MYQGVSKSVWNAMIESAEEVATKGQKHWAKAEIMKLIGEWQRVRSSSSAEYRTLK